VEMGLTQICGIRTRRFGVWYHKYENLLFNIEEIECKMDNVGDTFKTRLIKILSDKIKLPRSGLTHSTIVHE
jgi:hypothetical protein